MTIHPDTLTTFFKDYERASNSCDTDRLLAQFTETFTVTTPQGPQLVCAEDFARILPRRSALFNSLGCRAVTLHSLQVTSYNNHFALVDTTWKFHFELSDNRTDEFNVNSTFMVYINRNDPKIFLYVPHQDIMEILRERRILIATPEKSSTA